MKTRREVQRKKADAGGNECKSKSSRCEKRSDLEASSIKHARHAQKDTA